MADSTTVNLTEFRIEDIPLSCTWIVVGPPGSGKCLAPGTPVLMHDGSRRRVEDIKPGELIMGDDSSPRSVLTTTTGTDMMYTVTQNDGETYVVNEPHILCLKRNYVPRMEHRPRKMDFIASWMINNTKHTKRFPYASHDISESSAHRRAEKFLNSLVEGEDFSIENILEVSVKDYLSIPLNRRSKYKGYVNAIEYAEKLLPFDPFIFGMWVGYAESTYNQMLVRERFRKQVQERLFVYDMTVSPENSDGCKCILQSGRETDSEEPDDESTINPFTEFASSFDLENVKRIPDVFLNSSKQQRWELLSGIVGANGQRIDTSCYEFLYPKGEPVLDDIILLSRSLGLRIRTTALSIDIMSVCIYGQNLPPVEDMITSGPPSGNAATYTTDITVSQNGTGKYYGFEIDGNHRFVLGGFTVTHNTSFMENMCYYLKHRYPVARSFIGTDGGYKRMCKIMHPLYVSNYYDEDEEKQHILRQRTCELENGKGATGNYAINIIDDASDDPKIYRSKVMRGLFKLGSQHWNQLFMVGSQYAIDMPPDVRKSVSYVAIFFEPEDMERKKLYANFGGLAGSYDDFCALMDEVTGDYTCLIFKKRTQSKNREDNVFYFRTRQMGDWKFGCKEYQDWGKKRLDPNYKERIVL